MPGWVGPGSRIAGYVIEAQIGAGGMAVVYRARDEALGRLAAVKVLAPALAADEQFRNRFMRESRMVAGVDDSHVIPVYGAGQADGVLYIATRFIPGGDLAGVMRRNGGPLVAERAAAIVAQVASALDAAHEIGLVHRDVKPANILIDTTRGKAEHAYLSDFGLTRGTSSTTGLTSSGQFLGTPDYCAPEQIRGQQVDGRTDQYALACVAFVLLTGAPPFSREEPVATLFAHLSDSVPSAMTLRPGLASGVDAVLGRALAKSPQDRFPSCGEFAAALGQALTTTTAGTSAIAPAPASRPTVTAPPVVADSIPPQVPTFPSRVPEITPPAAGAAGTPPPSHGLAPIGYGLGPAGYGAAPGQPRSRRKIALLAGASAAVLVATGVGVAVALPGSPSSSVPSGFTGSRGTFAQAAYNAGLSQVVHPSSQQGGTVTLAASSEPDSLDPGNTYYPWTWDFSRLYATPLTTFKSAPGPAGNTLVPGIATSLGQVSDGGLLWTYHLKHGLKFSDGSPITSADVKYAVERTYDRTVLGNGPNYFQGLLADPNYAGPYKDPHGDLTSVSTPDPDTIQFHLVAPFPDFDYVASIPQTAPVPKARDTGANYQLDPVSSGPYEFQDYSLNKEAVLVPNPDWTQEEDTEARQLAGKITISFNVNSGTIDNELLAGNVDLEAFGDGLGAAAQSKVLASDSLKANADDVPNNRLWFAYLNTKVAPLNNVDCRRAIEYAADKSALQAALGGPVNGDIAATLQLPRTPGYQAFDLYNAESQPTGDVADAKTSLAKCGKPNGFTVAGAYRSDRPKEVAAAQALQAALARVGITLELQGYPSGSYYLNYAGSPAFVHQHDLGIDFGGWSSDWPDGSAMMYELIDGTAIVSTANVNISELNDTTINGLFANANSPSLTAAARNGIYGQIDKLAMSDAAILPEVYSKTLLYRPPNLANAYIEAPYGLYNYAVLG
jgi:peptide/nickel transport system substrate-binding protein